MKEQCDWWRRKLQEVPNFNKTRWQAVMSSQHSYKAKISQQIRFSWLHNPSPFKTLDLVDGFESFWEKILRICPKIVSQTRQDICRPVPPCNRCYTTWGWADRWTNRGGTVWPHPLLLAHDVTGGGQRLSVAYQPMTFHVWQAYCNILDSFSRECDVPVLTQCTS